ncbi:MAG: hypothetical protein OEW67_08615 [Cyclobacteriaceae bacterium]|nr:hypothetical protein [Cyclobacteriaceae bacterium]
MGNKIHLPWKVEKKKKSMIYYFRFLPFILIMISGLTFLSLRVIENNKVENESNEEQIIDDKNSDDAMTNGVNVKNINTTVDEVKLEGSIKQKTKTSQKKLTREEKIKNMEDSLIVRYYKRVYMKLNY